MGFDLKKLTAKQVLSLAKNLSGKSNMEIAEAIEQDHSSVKRYFNENDNEYFPSLMRIPRLCQALGNTFILDWIQAQIDDEEHTQGIRSDSDLLWRMNRLAGELGDVHKSVEKSLSGIQLDSFDPEQLLSELFKLERQVKEFRKSLQHISEDGLESEGWATAVAKGD